ncbi:MAG: SDR family NAD(P)-dependent oxidoreductase [Rhizomicrobium sp.]
MRRLRRSSHFESRRLSEVRSLSVSSTSFLFVTWPLTSIYCASKYALEGWAQSLRQELHPLGVRVALLEPGSNPTALNDNLGWGSRTANDASPYSIETAAYRAYRSVLARRKRKTMSKTARLAVKIARSKSPSLHNPVGIATTVTYTLSRWFPQKFGVDLMDWLARRTFRQAARSR